VAGLIEDVIINQDLIDSRVSDFSPEYAVKIIKALELYIGKTWHQALEEHSTAKK
jgi:hypothetical protein